MRCRRKGDCHGEDSQFWNDWDPLKRVIVGLCDNSVIPPEEPATSEKVPVDSEMRGMWGLRPLRTVEVGNACLGEPREGARGARRGRRPPDAPAVEPGHRHARLPQRLHDDLHAAPCDILLTIGNEIMASANLPLPPSSTWPTGRR